MDGSPARAPRPIAWVDGRVLPASEATVPLLDDGFLRGDAVFDAVLVRRGRTHALDRHLSRLRASGKRMGIRIPVVTGLVRDLLVAWGERDGALKIVVTRDGTVRGLLSAPAWPSTLSLIPVDMAWGGPLTGVKTVSYAANMLALRTARQEHGDDALVVTDGIVQELPTGALCWIVDGRVHAPDASRQPILESITLGELENVVEVHRGVHRLEDVVQADELFVVSATRPVLPVDAVGEHEYEAPGPVTAQIRTAFGEWIDAHLDPLP